MKAVLILDMPTKCGNCRFVEKKIDEYDIAVYYCTLHKVHVDEDDDICEKLIPLPKHKNEYIDIKAIGWNACLNEIMRNNDEV